MSFAENDVTTTISGINNLTQSTENIGGQNYTVYTNASAAVQDRLDLQIGTGTPSPWEYPVGDRPYGRLLYFPGPAIYQFDSPLVIRSGANLVGDGSSTLLDFSGIEDDRGAFELGDTNFMGGEFRFENFYVRSAGYGLKGTTGLTGRVTASLLARNIVWECGDFAIYAGDELYFQRSQLSNMTCYRQGGGFIYLFGNANVLENVSTDGGFLSGGEITSPAAVYINGGGNYLRNVLVEQDGNVSSILPIKIEGDGNRVEAWVECFHTNDDDAIVYIKGKGNVLRGELVSTGKIVLEDAIGTILENLYVGDLGGRLSTVLNIKGTIPDSTVTILHANTFAGVSNDIGPQVSVVTETRRHYKSDETKSDNLLSQRVYHNLDNGLISNRDFSAGVTDWNFYDMNSPTYTSTPSGTTPSSDDSLTIDITSTQTGHFLILAPTYNVPSHLATADRTMRVWFRIDLTGVCNAITVDQDSYTGGSRVYGDLTFQDVPANGRLDFYCYNGPGTIKISQVRAEILT